MRTQLPEKWYVVTTEESNKIICDWFDKTKSTQTDRTIGNYYTYEMYGWMFSASKDKYVPNFTEITFEEFKVLVLGEKLQENYEIF